MYEQFANALVIAIYIYLGLGAFVAIVVVSFGLTRVDSEAQGAGLGFRAIIFPGAVALWPLLLKRCIAGRGDPPAQKDPHR